MITILKFYAAWCKPCAILSGRLEEFEDIITNVNIEEEPQLSRDYHIRHVPTLVFLKDGKEVHRTTLLLSPKEFQSILDELNDSSTDEFKIDSIIDNFKEE